MFCSDMKTYSSHLSNVQMSSPSDRPFAILKAANGVLLDSIGRGMLTIQTVTVIAYIFKDKDLVHNLLGITPFADRGCKATFDATQFCLYYLDLQPILVGARHAHNLWRIAMPERQEPSLLAPSYSADQVELLHQSSHTDAEHITSRFVNASLGSPPPSTFLKAVTRGYINGPRQFPRLTTKNVRRNTPNSEATARGHLRKSPTSQPHANSQSVSALQRHHKANIIQNLWRQSKKDKTVHARFDPTTVTKSTTLHFDYTGPLPERCSAGTLHFMISCYES
jgi:hypothetical protein